MHVRFSIMHEVSMNNYLKCYSYFNILKCFNIITSDMTYDKSGVKIQSGVNAPFCLPLSGDSGRFLIFRCHFRGFYYSTIINQMKITTFGTFYFFYNRCHLNKKHFRLEHFLF